MSHQVGARILIQVLDVLRCPHRSKVCPKSLFSRVWVVTLYSILCISQLFGFGFSYGDASADVPEGLRDGEVTCERGSLVESVLTGAGNGGRGLSPPGRSRAMRHSQVGARGKCPELGGGGGSRAMAEEGRRQRAGKWSPRTSASFVKPCQTRAFCVT